MITRSRARNIVSFLIDCGHDPEHVFKVFHEIGCMTRNAARNSTGKGKKDSKHCVFISKFNPRVCNISSVFGKHRQIIDNDELAKQILPAERLKFHIGEERIEKKIQKLLLAPSNPYKTGTEANLAVQYVRQKGATVVQIFF